MGFKRHKWYHDYACSSDEAYCLVCRKTDSELKGQNECLGQPPSELTQLRAEVELWTEHTVEQAKRVDKAEAEVKRLTKDINEYRTNGYYEHKRAEKAEASLAVAVKALGKIGADSWFHTTGEQGGPHTAWRGKGEPDEIANKALKEIKEG